MKKLIVLFVSVLVLSSCTKQQKIAFVNTEKLIQDFNGTKKAEEELKKKQDEMQKQLQQLGMQFEAKIKKMSPRQQRKNYEKLMQEQQQLQQVQQQAQYQLQLESQKSIEAVSKQVNNFVKEYGKKHQYNFILGTVSVNGAVMYGEEKADITYDILKELNQKFDAGELDSETKKEDEKSDKEEVKKVMEKDNKNSEQDKPVTEQTKK
jgi:outer membrane protein